MNIQKVTPRPLPADHLTRLQRALLSLEGLSVGDAFGECSFSNQALVVERLSRREAPPAPWFFTDDTVMARSIVRCLQRNGYIDQDDLATAFAGEYAADPTRGYGGMAHRILQAIGNGTHWRIAAGSAFDGQGSHGNGGAMRAAPVGAYFADDLQETIAQAKASAEVTHAHPDGQSGAIAVALAAAWMVRSGAGRDKPSLHLIRFVLEHMPQTETFFRLRKALELPLELSPTTAAGVLGNGSQVIASDTVPFCLWCAARHANDYEAALWSTASVFGDCDTNCAIVGGIVSLGAGKEAIPRQWLDARERLGL
jgi:ADP-ribosylglycohydrolase